MAQLAMAAAVAGTVLSAGSAIKEGNDANKMAQYEAGQMEANAGQTRAIAQRQSIEERRKARLVESDLQNRAAAGGGSASDAGVINLAQNIDAEGEYNAMSALYEGEDKAINLEDGARMRRFEGKQAKKAGRIKALTTVLSSAGSMGMGAKYGAGGPPNSVTAIGQQGGWSSNPYSGSAVKWNS